MSSLTSCDTMGPRISADAETGGADGVAEALLFVSRTWPGLTYPYDMSFTPIKRGLQVSCEDERDLNERAEEKCEKLATVPS